MKMTRIALLATCLTFAAGTANAIGNSDRGEQLRQSSEMNLPLQSATNAPRGQAGAAMRMNAADTRAAEFRINTDMMRPQTFGSPTEINRAATTAARNPDDRAAAEMMKRTDMMKPD